MIVAVLAAAFVPPPPPRSTTPDLLAWMPGSVTCAGRSQRMLVPRRPLTSLAWSGAAPTTVSLMFAIDPSGRTHAIRREPQAFVYGADDIEPALAATRFEPGIEREGCTLTYTAQRVPLNAAPVADLMSYSINPVNGALPRAGWERIAPPGARCLAEPRPAAVLRGYPDFRSLPGTPGVRDWSMIGYDLDASGRPVHARVVTGTGNAALDRASVAAVQASRFTGGARTGCLYPYWKAAAPLAAPADANLDALRPAGSTCPTERNWASTPPLRYPEAFRRRGIEGWAVVGFDIAPWGATGNVRVLAAEPAAAFGEQAASLIRGATRAASASGMSGCVERVRFVMDAPERSTGEAAAPAY